mmetsp:Transcript_90753/g.236387  ORF Transcript_90753/g.236387 Transcript_90753/m.236387 type:complete len:400 (+) Transcript_90753:2032-3231(+)
MLWQSPHQARVQLHALEIVQRAQLGTEVLAQSQPDARGDAGDVLPQLLQASCGVHVAAGALLVARGEQQGLGPEPAAGPVQEGGLAGRVVRPVRLDLDQLVTQLAGALHRAAQGSVLRETLRGGGLGQRQPRTAARSGRALLQRGDPRPQLTKRGPHAVGTDGHAPHTHGVHQRLQRGGREPCVKARGVRGRGCTGHADAVHLDLLWRRGAEAEQPLLPSVCEEVHGLAAGLAHRAHERAALWRHDAHDAPAEARHASVHLPEHPAHLAGRRSEVYGLEVGQHHGLQAALQQHAHRSVGTARNAHHHHGQPQRWQRRPQLGPQHRQPLLRPGADHVSAVAEQDQDVVGALAAAAPLLARADDLEGALDASRDVGAALAGQTCGAHLLRRAEVVAEQVGA